MDVYAPKPCKFSIALSGPSYVPNIPVVGRRRIVISDRSLKDFKKLSIIPPFPSFTLIQEYPSEETVLYVGKLTVVYRSADEIGKMFASESASDASLIDSVSKCDSTDRNRVSALVKELSELKSKLANLSGAGRARPEDVEALVKSRVIRKKLTTILERGRQIADFRASAVGGEALRCGWTNSSEKIRKIDFPLVSTPVGEGSIDVARNESEASQLLILPGKNLSNVEVLARGRFKSADGSLLPKGAVTVHPLGYLFCEFRGHPDLNGYLPDPILTYTSKMDLKAGEWQPYWVEVKVPKGQKPGIYTGRLLVKADGVKPVRPRLKIRVRSFTLPDGPPIPLILARNPHNLDGIVPMGCGNQKRFKLRYDDLITKLLCEHRLYYTCLYRDAPPPPTVKESRSWWAMPCETAEYMVGKGGADMFMISNFGTIYTSKDEARIAAYFKKVDDAIEGYRKLGILDKGFFYIDEVHVCGFQALKRFSDRLRKRYPGIPIVSTTMDRTLGCETCLTDSIDVWVPEVQFFPGIIEKGYVKRARARGDKVWWYSTLKVSINATGVFTRLLMGLSTWRFKPQGYLVCGLYGWRIPDEKIPYLKHRRNNFMQGGPRLDWIEGNYGYAGLYTWLYPMRKGPVPSIRMKKVRDGFEDFLYLRLLKTALSDVDGGKVSVPRNGWRSDARSALDVPLELAPVGPEPDPKLVEPLMNRRKIAADLLEEYKAASAGETSTTGK
jgi:hypothetical protein